MVGLSNARGWLRLAVSLGIALCAFALASQGASAAPGGGAGGAEASASRGVEGLYVQTARHARLSRLRSGRARLTLTGVPRRTRLLLDRPARGIELVPVRRMVAQWRAAFASAAPNAALELPVGKRVRTVGLELLRRPVYRPRAGTLAFAVRLLPGQRGARRLFGRRHRAPSLMIDATAPLYRVEMALVGGGALPPLYLPRIANVRLEVVSAANGEARVVTVTRMQDGDFEVVNELDRPVTVTVAHGGAPPSAPARIDPGRTWVRGG